MIQKISEVATLPFIALDNDNGTVGMPGGTQPDFIISYKSPSEATLVATSQEVIDVGSGHYGVVFSAAMIGATADDWFHYNIIGTPGGDFATMMVILILIL